MPAKKAPQKAPKKAARKHPGKHPSGDISRDIRRTFEHLGRVRVISGMLQTERRTVGELTEAADIAFRAELYRDSAELLRAAEHLAFADLLGNDIETISAELARTITDEVARLLDPIHEGAVDSLPAHLSRFHQRLAAAAMEALRHRAYRAALELARGAEALTHVHAIRLGMAEARARSAC